MERRPKGTALHFAKACIRTAAVPNAFRLHSVLLDKAAFIVAPFYTKLMKIPVLLLGLAALFLFGCGSSSPQEVEGYVPIYQSDSSIASIHSSDPQPTVTAGKIYTMGNMLYQVEPGAGIHVIDISNPSAPEKISFIRIMGVSDIAIKSTMLYANNYNDLVIVDISNIQAVKLLKRQENAFQFNATQLPPGTGYFECVDPSKGKVVGWKKQMIHSPKCRN